MPRVETLDADTWREFVAAPVAVLILGKTTCPACQAYGEELNSWLATTTAFPDVRFGKIFLDERGLIDFKRASPWLAEVDDLPFTQIYRDGEHWKHFPGGGVERLRRRLETLQESGGSTERRP
jgi:hypothetical protein